MECELRNAELFCTCTDKEIFLCAECFPNHSKKRNRKGHTTWSVSDLLVYKDPRFFDLHEGLSSIKEQAKLQVKEVDRAIAEYRCLVDRAVWEIKVASDQVIAELEEIKRKLSKDVDTAIEEVERTLSDPQPRLLSKYGLLFRALAENSVPFHLFAFTPPSCTMPSQSLISFQYTLTPLKDVLREAKKEPRITPAVPKLSLPPTYFDAKKETSEVAIAHYLHSIQTCTVHFPTSLEFATCHHNLGELYKDLNKCEQTQTHLTKAAKLYQAYFPTDYKHAKCLETLGLLYSDMKLFQDSETSFLRALSVYSTEQHLHYATCLSNLGQLYKEMERWDKAEAKMRKAKQLFETYFPEELDFADNLWFLGILCKERKRKSEAIRNIQAALEIYQKGKKQRSINSCKLLLKELGQSPFPPLQNSLFAKVKTEDRPASK